MTHSSQQPTGPDPFDKTTWDDDARKYFGIIDQACAEKKDVMLSNGQPAHAVYIIYKFLENAERHVRLFSGQLLCALEGVPVYRNPYIIEAALAFLRKPETALSVILEQELDVPSESPPEAHPFIHAVKEAKENGNIQGALKVYRIWDEDWDILKEVDFAYHWMVMDQQAYRLEKDKEKATAFVNFGDAKKATQLGSLFDTIAERSRELCEV